MNTFEFEDHLHIQLKQKGDYHAVSGIIDLLLECHDALVDCDSQCRGDDHSKDCKFNQKLVERLRPLLGLT